MWGLHLSQDSQHCPETVGVSKQRGVFQDSGLFWDSGGVFWNSRVFQNTPKVFQNGGCSRTARGVPAASVPEHLWVFQITVTVPDQPELVWNTPPSFQML